jgi:hypothetical protein
MYVPMYVNVHSTLNQGTKYQGQTVLALNVCYILNQNYRVWGHSLLCILGFGSDQKT